MHRELENKMVVDAHWREFEKEPEVCGECAGCQEDIFEGDDILVVGEYMIHQNEECCYQFVSGMAYFKTAEKK